jgi:hypothetical protein
VRLLPHHVHRVDIGTALHQEFDGLIVAIVGRADDGGLAHLRWRRARTGVGLRTVA